MDRSTIASSDRYEIRYTELCSWLVTEQYKRHKKAEELVLRPGYDHFSFKTLQYHTRVQKMLLYHSIKQINEKQYVQKNNRCRYQSL